MGCAPGPHEGVRARSLEEGLPQDRAVGLGVEDGGVQRGAGFGGEVEGAVLADRVAEILRLVLDDDRQSSAVPPGW
jgi:hypothetical protein